MDEINDYSLKQVVVIFLGDEAENETGFAVLGEDLAKGRPKVRRVLPRWLANPDIVSVDLSDQQVAVTDMEGLDPVVLKNLASNGVTHFFPVQRQLIPYMLANKVKSHSHNTYFYMMLIHSVFFKRK